MLTDGIIFVYKLVNRELPLRSILLIILLVLAAAVYTKFSSSVSGGSSGRQEGEIDLKKNLTPLPTFTPTRAPIPTPTPTAASTPAPVLNTKEAILLHTKDEQERCFSGSAIACRDLNDKFRKIMAFPEGRFFLKAACLKGNFISEECWIVGADSTNAESLEAKSRCEAGQNRYCMIYAGKAMFIKAKDEAKKYMNLACERGEWDACTMVGEVLSPSELAGAGENCKKGIARACIMAAAYYHDEGTREQARPWFEAACEAGDARSCRIIGMEFGVDAEVEQMQGQCAQGNGKTCMKAAGIQIAKKNLDSARQLIRTACEKGLKTACGMEKEELTPN